MVWPFGGKAESSSSTSSPYDEFVQPPPGGSPFVDPPTRPRSLKGNKSASLPAFSGFTPPPASRGPYESEDYSGFVSPHRETPGIDDDSRLRLARISEPSFADRYITNPKTRQCYENVKMGIKMGAAVGGVFGTLTGTIQAVSYRRPIYLPLAIVGGAGSFGFFLGIGMIVRCI